MALDRLLMRRRRIVGEVADNVICPDGTAGGFLKITHLTYARVAHDATPRFPEFRPIDAGVMDFLGDHIDSLFEMADKSDATPPGCFIDSAAQRLFRHLHTGSADDFLKSADALTRRLIGLMNGRTAEGLLVCVRATAPAYGGRVAGVLKLEVVTQHGAVLHELDSGETVLAAVTDLLDSPGKLHKGALVASELPDGQVVCGDRVAHGMARYFPEAFGIQIFDRPSAAAKAFFDAVAACAGPLLPEVAAAWPTARPGPPRKVLAELGRKVPGLTASLQADIAERLETAPRPVARLDSRRTVKQTYQAGAIIIAGPIEEMGSRVHVAAAPDGTGWRITVDSPDRPVLTHQ
jgi:hypothetical protein